MSHFPCGSLSPLLSLTLGLGLIVAGQASSGEESTRVAKIPAPGAQATTTPKLEAPHKPKPAPVRDAVQVRAAISRGVAFLRQRQNPDGSWGSAHRTKGLDIYAPVPGAHHAFRSATTALCVMALSESGDTDADTAAACRRGEDWLLENLGHLRRATPDTLYNNWGHAYSIQALAGMLGRAKDDPARRQRIRDNLVQQIDRLVRYECVDGGWCYYDFVAHTQRPSGSSISFVTATALVALDAARQAGVAAPEKMTKRAMDSLRRQRKSDFSYLYGEYLKYRPMMPVNRPGGSLGRNQACNLAMHLWGDKTVDEEVFAAWLDRLFARNLWLDMGRKRPIPHESWLQVAGYFFYFGHYYAARCIEQLPSQRRGPYLDLLAQVLLHLQEKDGSWWDFPLYDYHQQYGTAFAVLSLVRCLKGP